MGSPDDDYTISRLDRYRNFLAQRCHRGNDSANAILFVGMVTPLKGIHYLINAFSFIAEEFRRSQLLIIGKEENVGYAEDLRHQIRKLGLENRVRFIGHQSQAELAIRMSEAAVLVLPSTSEGLGRVMIEAMATGTPVIGSRVGGIPDLINDGVNGFLIAPGDEQAWPKSSVGCLNNPRSGSCDGPIWRASFAAQTFSTENYVKGYRQIFEMSADVSAGGACGFYSLILRPTRTIVSEHFWFYATQQLENIRCAERPIVQFPTWSDMEVFLERAQQTETPVVSMKSFTVVLLSLAKVSHHLIAAFAQVAKDFHSEHVW